MKTLPIFAVVLALLALGAIAKDREEKAALRAAKLEQRPTETTDSAASTPAPSAAATGYDAFRNVRTKNIFDPTRRGTRIDTGAATKAASSNRTRSLALTGTMVTDGKSLAFFGGSADGNRVVPVGTSVSNFKVVSIAPTQVSLEHDGKTILLDVGRALSLDAPADGGAPGAITDAPAEQTPDTPQPALPAASGDKSDILRRMMERRAKEVGK